MRDHPIEDCQYMIRIDDQCRAHAEPHSDVCAKHRDYDDVGWQLGHSLADCCAEHCDGTPDHYDNEGEVLAA